MHDLSDRPRPGVAGHLWEITEMDLKGRSLHKEVDFTSVG